jgi:hypothetical protein
MINHHTVAVEAEQEQPAEEQQEKPDKLAEAVDQAAVDHQADLLDQLEARPRNNRQRKTSMMQKTA